MAISPKDFITFAQDLPTAGEASVRSAVSRAYYGAYHGVLAFEERLPSGGVATRDEGVHGTLYQRLQNPTISKDDPRYVTSRRLGVLGLTLHGMRIRADYQLQEDISQADRELAIAQALRILEMSSI